MATRNALETFNNYTGFNSIVLNKKDSLGRAQSAWAAGTAYNPSLTAAEKYNTTGLKLMAMQDDAFCFIVAPTHTYPSNIGTMVSIIFVVGNGLTARPKLNLKQSKGSERFSNDKLTTNPFTNENISYPPTGAYNYNLADFLITYGDADETIRSVLGNIQAYHFSVPDFIWTDTQQYLAASYNDTPTFSPNDGEGILKYIQTGDDSARIYAYSVDWTVYLTDSNTPQIKLVWRSEILEQMFESGEESPDNVYINTYTYAANQGKEKQYIARAKYSDGFIRTSFLNVTEIQSQRLLEYFLQVSPLNNPEFNDFPIMLYMELYTSKGLFSRCYVSMTYNKSYNGDKINDDNPLDESTVTIIIGDGEDNSGYVPPINDDDTDGGTASGGGLSGLNLLSTTYRINRDDLMNVSKQLWSSDFISAIRQVNSSPIENIISCKIVPYTINGTQEVIVLGNYNTKIIGHKASENVKITLGEINVSGSYNSFLDYSPYTKLTIFIPFVGFKELDTSQFMNKKLTVEYIIDIITASCKALLFANDIYIQSFEGQCGIDIPITASNRAQVEASYISGALGAIGELASGNISGAISGAIDTAMTQYHYNTQGAYNPSCGSYETRLCYLIVDRPTADYPTSYGHNFGYPCGLTKSLSSLHGFTKCGGDIDLSNCAATNAEKNEIVNLLTTGVFL